jgi:branched-chain amino acid transport system permease protein
LLQDAKARAAHEEVDTLDFAIVQTLNGLSFGALLFLLASGFTLIFGLLRIVNLSHGALYLLGGYMALVTVSATGNYVVGVLAAGMTIGVLCLLMDRTLLRRVRGREMPEVLLTVGVAFVLADLNLLIFGGNPEQIAAPAALTGSVELFGQFYPRLRVIVIAVAVVVGVALWLLHSRTTIGAVIRAGVDDRETAAVLGINIDRVFTGLFALGGVLAGVAGAIGGTMLTLLPGEDINILLFALVVVIIGGMGSIPGAAVGSALVGLIDAFSRAWIPELSYFTIFAPMALVLVLRPTGLFGSRE